MRPESDGFAMSRRRYASQFILIGLLGSAMGTILAFGVLYALNWHPDGPADPRCVLRWRGYVELYEVMPGVRRVSCVYRPKINEQWPRLGDRE